MQDQELPFVKAAKTQLKLRLAIVGPSGSGKTYSALLMASELGKKTALIDTERGSAKKYADIFKFSVLELENFHPYNFIKAIKSAEAQKFDILIIDSLSHAWNGADGALELVDMAAARLKTANSFAAWREVTPLHNQMIDAILKSELHIIVTMRAKTDYSLERADNGKTFVRKVGLQPIQRDGLEYEFDIVGDMDLTSTMVISKTRCPALQQSVFKKPGPELAHTILKWLNSGEPVKKRVSSVGNRKGMTILINSIKSRMEKLNKKNFITAKKLSEFASLLKDPQVSMEMLRLLEKQLVLLARLEQVKSAISQQVKKNFYRQILSTDTQGIKALEKKLKKLEAA
jgi:ABC-type dipeptide/oligopeptide/nickel transport system ATPase component